MEQKSLSQSFSQSHSSAGPTLSCSQGNFLSNSSFSRSSIPAETQGNSTRSTTPPYRNYNVANISTHPIELGFASFVLFGSFLWNWLLFGEKKLPRIPLEKSSSSSICPFRIFLREFSKKDFPINITIFGWIFQEF